MADEPAIQRETQRRAPGDGRRKLDKFAHYGQGIGMFIGALSFAAVQAYNFFYDAKKEKQLADMIEQQRAEDLRTLQEQLKESRAQIEALKRKDGKP